MQKYANGDSTSIKAEVEKIFGYKLDDTRNVIGHVALVQRSKRQDFVLNVIAELKKRGINSVGIFAGEAREPDFLEELKQHAKDLNISDDVIFLGRRSDIPDLLKMADVLMIPSSEGFPLAGLEAAAAGVPVAACNVAGAEEFIRVSGDGACFTENNVDEAVKAIETIMARKAEMAENARTFAAKMSNAEYASRIGTEFGKVV